MADDWGRRQIALDLAIKTVLNSRTFTVSQVIHTADSYEKYISDGWLPPLATPAGTEVAEPLKEGDSA